MAIGRRGLGLATALAVLTVAASATAADPPDGIIDLEHRSVEWQGASWPVGVTAVAQRGVEPICAPEEADPAHVTCDHFHLTVNVPKSYWERHPGGVKVTASWPDPNNKLEISAYDEKGKFVGWGLSGGASSLVIKNAHGTYDIIVSPTLIVRPTDYKGFARIISVPRTPKHPSLGGPMTYRSTPVKRVDPDKPPINDRVHYSGEPLKLFAHPLKVPTMEPTLGVDKKGVVFMNVRVDNLDLSPLGTVRSPRVYRSTDGGEHWEEAGDLPGNTWHTTTNDPYVYVDRDYGRVFWADLSFSLSGSVFSFSDDRGRSWTVGYPTPGGINDHETIVTAVPPEGSGLVTVDPEFPKIVYYCVNQLVGIACTRSLDGGLTFARVGEPLTNQTLGCVVSTTGHLSADKDGRVFLGSSGCNIPIVANSSDGGVTWNNVTVTNKIRAAYHDVETASDTAGNVYALFQGDDPSLPYLSVSRDHGATWSRPVMIAPPDVRETSMLTLKAGAPGRVAVGMVTTTVADPGDNHRPWSYRMAITQNALHRAPKFVSNAVTLPDRQTKLVNRGGCCPGMYDFLDLVLAPTPGWPAWGSLAVPCIDRCVTKTDGVNNLDNGLGYAVEQISGPSLQRR